MKKAKILLSEFVTHNVKRFIVEKPVGYRFIPGQATEVALDKDGWRNKKHPFTFTSLNDDLVLEFTIKGYPVRDNPGHSGMTETLHKMKSGEALLIDEPWGTINYKGKGIFIAGGAGITPFIAIIRHLKKEGKISGNKLIFSNKEARDVILEKELRDAFGENLILTLTREKRNGFESGRVDRKFLKKHISDFGANFYICGPKNMISGLRETLGELGANPDSIVFEK